MKAHIKISLALFIIVLITTIIYSGSIKNKVKIQDQTDHVQSVIAETDLRTYQLLNHLQFSESENYVSFDQTIEAQQKKGNYDEIEVFIYENMSLLYWSSNSIHPPPPKVKADELWYSGNGFYRIIKLQADPYTYFGLYLIKNDYNYENQYLQNTFNRHFKLPEFAEISLDSQEDIRINDADGKYLFSLKLPSEIKPGKFQIYFLAVCYFLSIILFLILVQNLFFKLTKTTESKLFYLLIFVLFLLVLRYTIYLLPYPTILYTSNIFAPYYYGYSDLIPSLGDLFINSLFLLFISLSIFKYPTSNFTQLSKSKYLSKILSIVFILLSVILFEIVNFVIKSLVIDSRIPMDLNNIFSLSLMSFFSYFIIALVLISYVLITNELIKISYQLTHGKGFPIRMVVVLLILILFSISNIMQPEPYHFYLVIYFGILGYFYSTSSMNLSLNKILLITILFSIQSTHSLHEYNKLREKEHRKLLAVNLSSEQRDPITEFLFQSESDRIFDDNKLKDILNNYETEGFDYKEFESYFLATYFKGHWNKFELQMTICSGTDILNIQPDDIEINCINYFEDLKATSTISTESPELFFINYGPGENGYFAVLDFSNSLTQVKELIVFVEFFPKMSTQKLGFPDLLIDNSVTHTPDIAGYSYAKYQDGELYKRVGPYYYDIKFISEFNHEKPYSFFHLNDFNHLLYTIDDSRFLLISIKEKTILDILSPFSYLFTLYLLVSLLIVLIFINPGILKKAQLSFKTKLQLSISSVLLFSFLSIGFFTLYYINNLNNRKNEAILSEKTHSVLIEMQHKFMQLEAFDETVKDYVSDLLVKFSNVFFTDINLFDINGELIATSRPQIFEEKLISIQMQPTAFKGLRYEGKSLFIQNENIGKQAYLSAYIPFTNHIGEVIGYLNLPYFAKELELNREISNLLIVYINIYVILIGISLILAVLISNYISRPVKMIIDKIKQVKLGGQNEAIALHRKDEIGELVAEYNRMIDELSRSADLLAKSEREYAWREMAKQVAHEIKNPLTPMKLSVQHLQRAWNNSQEGWDKRLEKFTRNMIEQIDSLSAIATEFSDFAKMPTGKKHKTNLVESINSSLKLFRNYENIDIVFTYDSNDDYFVLGDKEQLSRVFNNLLKNAIQAIGNSRNGRIIVNIITKNAIHEITISDNGSGISDEIAAKIFSPNFTTKSGGMGLGLAIVKSIISTTGGEISYFSTKDKGTTFIINLPAL